MDLYTRLLEEREPLFPEEEKRREQWAKGERRMAAYIRRRVVEGLPPGSGPYGYVTREELLEEKARYIEDLKALAQLMVSGPRSQGLAYRYKGLQNRYSREYSELRNALLGLGNYRQDNLL